MRHQYLHLITSSLGCEWCDTWGTVVRRRNGLYVITSDITLATFPRRTNSILGPGAPAGELLCSVVLQLMIAHCQVFCSSQGPLTMWSSVLLYNSRQYVDLHYTRDNNSLDPTARPSQVLGNCRLSCYYYPAEFQVGLMSSVVPCQDSSLNLKEAAPPVVS